MRVTVRYRDDGFTVDGHRCGKSKAVAEQQMRRAGMSWSQIGLVWMLRRAYPRSHFYVQREHSECDRVLRWEVRVFAPPPWMDSIMALHRTLRGAVAALESRRVRT